MPSTPSLTVTGLPLYAKAITPHNTNNLTDESGNETAQYVYVGVAGDVTVLPSGNLNQVTFAMLAGSMVPVRCKRVYSTGTTASDLVGVF